MTKNEKHDNRLYDCLFRPRTLPRGLWVRIKGIHVTGDGYLYFDCDCDTHLTALQLNVDTINGYPVANVYVYVDGEERALTGPFGYACIEDAPYGDQRADIRYNITNPDFLGDYRKSALFNFIVSLQLNFVTFLRIYFSFFMDIFCNPASQ